MYSSKSIAKGSNPQQTEGGKSAFFQPKLTVNAPNDAYEQEADSVADQVMRMPLNTPQYAASFPTIQRKCAHCEQEEQLQKKDMGEEEESVQMMPIFRKADGGGFNASPQLTSQLSSSKGGGSAMLDGTKSFMESRFGRDFSNVRIHDNSTAAAMSDSIQAKAFTHGSDIYFNSGQFQPNTEGGQRLLAHELVHTVQHKNQFSANSNTLSRFQIEGPFNYNDPVHEEITLASLRNAGFANSRSRNDSPYLWEFQRGVIWNDDPEGLQFENNEHENHNWSTGLEWYGHFSEGHERAEHGEPIGVNQTLTARTHFGDLQFLHGMAVEGERAIVTKERMMQWAEFTYRVAIGDISDTTELRSIPVAGIPELFNSPELRNLTIRQLFHVHDHGNTRRRAIGSLLHMIQDSFAEGHVERRGLGQRTNPPIVSFHSYTHQDSHLHDAHDRMSSSGSTTQERIRNTPGALNAIEHGSSILQFYRQHRPWSEVQDYLNTYVFVLENPEATAGAGAEFAHTPSR